MYNFVAIFGLLFATPIYGFSQLETDVTHVDESAISGFGSDSDYDYNYLYEDVDKFFNNKSTISPNGEFELLGWCVATYKLIIMLEKCCAQISLFFTSYEWSALMAIEKIKILGAVLELPAK